MNDALSCFVTILWQSLLVSAGVLFPQFASTAGKDNEAQNAVVRLDSAQLPVPTRIKVQYLSMGTYTPKLSMETMMANIDRP